MRNKTIVIVGGTDGIGRAIANALVKENTVLIIGRSEQKGESFKEEHGENARFLICDLSLLNNIPGLVAEIKSQLDTVDFIVHTADNLRTKRLDTSEGLEISIAINHYSRVLFNQLMVGEESGFRPERIIHIAFAGFPVPKNFIKNFPLPDTASSFKGHGLGQVSNDFYGLFMKPKLKKLGIKINILNPGTVDTNIRRNGELPALLKMLSPIIGFLLTGKIRTPEEYAVFPLEILNNENADANHFTLIDSNGKGITGKAKVNVVDTQQELYEHTKKLIEEIVPPLLIKKWL